MRNFAVNSVKAALFALLGGGFLSHCARPMAPQGGPRDTLPPRVLIMTPGYGTRNFTDKRIYVEFDEFIQIKNQQKEFFTSPGMAKTPVITLRGRGIMIDLKDSLIPNTTYSLNFGNSVVDNNEGNPLSGFRYVFSTGTEIDSMFMSGYAADAYTRDSVQKAFIFFYADSLASLRPRDSLPLLGDSTIFKVPASAIARTEKNGIFIAENLKPVPYRVYLLDDRNGNQRYEPGVDKVAFLDSLYNPVTMPDFNIWFDTSRLYRVADPQLYFRVFMDTPFKRQLLASATRPLQRKAMLQFGAPEPVIERLVLDGIDSADIITEYLKPTRDSIALWFRVPAEQLPDTIKGEITYLRHDSVNRLIPHTEKLRLGWKFFEEKKKKEDKDAGPPPNPFKVEFKPAVGSGINPEQHLSFTFEQPLVELDTARIELTRADGDKLFRARYRLAQDTLGVRKWNLSAAWVNGGKYTLLIPAGAFVNISDQRNDTIKLDYTVFSPEKFATIVLNVKGKTPESKYVLQLTDAQGKVTQEIRDAASGTHTFRYVAVGTVRVRVVEDMNANGIWDTGNLIRRIQPERVEYFIQPTGDEEIATKENWELEFEVDMASLFAPITMQSVMDQLRKAEMVRARKAAKAAELKERQNQHGAPAPASLGGGIGRPSLP